MFDRHTAENMFNKIAKLKDARFPNGWAKLIGVSSDGKNTMTGRYRGLVTRLVSAAEYNVLRVWCAPHRGLGIKDLVLLWKPSILQELKRSIRKNSAENTSNMR